MPVLDWIGKKQVINHDREVPFIKRVESLSVGTSENLIIKGDNLEAGKALLPYYYNKDNLHRKYRFLMATKGDIEGIINKVKTL